METMLTRIYLYGLRRSLPVLLAVSCTHAPPEAEVFAYQHSSREGVLVVTDEGEEQAAGTDASQSFAWDRNGEGFVIAHGDGLERVSLDGERSLVLKGYRHYRFPDVRQRDGAIVVGATLQSSTELAWRMILIEEQDAPPIDLGPGFDPCFTADGKGLLFESLSNDGPSIYHLDLASRTRRRLAAGYTPSASPDGQSVYFSFDGNLHRVGISDTPAEPTQITSAGTYDRFASPSGDGERVLFFRSQDDTDSVIEHTLATGEERVLISGNATMPAYRP